MSPTALGSFRRELEKLAGRNAMELLQAKALRKGVDPKNIGAIKQVGFIAQQGDKSRAADVANRVRVFLNNTPKQVAA